MLLNVRFGCINQQICEDGSSRARGVHEMRAWEGGKWRRSLPGLINVFSLCVLVAVSCLQRGPRDQVRGRRATKRNEIINNKIKDMEERRKRRKLSNSRCSASTEGPQQQPQKRSQQGGRFAPTDRQNTWRHRTGSSYGRAGAKKANQPLTPTQISIDPANLSAIKAERTWL